MLRPAAVSVVAVSPLPAPPRTFSSPVMVSVPLRSAVWPFKSSTAPEAETVPPLSVPLYLPSKVTVAPVYQPDICEAGPR